MSVEFASALSEKIQNHPEFWSDLLYVQTKGVEFCIGTTFEKDSKSLTTEKDVGYVQRLMYCASVFAQSSDEGYRGMAQTIALSCLLAKPEEHVRERTSSVLAQIGNFPGIQYVNQHHGDYHSSFLSYLRSILLESINSVQIRGLPVALTDFQLNVWRSLQGTSSASVSAPTSAGKSYVVTEFLCQRVLDAQAITAIYVAPTRALLAEVHKKIHGRFLEHKDVRVSTVPALDVEARPKQIFVLTQERLHVLLAIADVQADIVIVDEAQNLADGSRGMILQDCLEKLKQIKSDTKIILLSPGAEGFENAARLLDLGSIEIKQTRLSAVMQNRIQVKAVEGNSKALNLALLNREGVTDLGEVKTSRGVGDPQTRLAAVALELGQKGGALVYATGPVDCEETAEQLTSDLPMQQSKDLSDLSKFIKDHIHPDYGLSEMVLHSVAFHYGRMPTLLREAIEAAFRNGHIKYLVCTTTLFQGVNLPARSVFIDTPTRGRGTLLDPAHLWNFAGRAGRLGKDLIGNVFLVDYDTWSEQKLNEHADYKVIPAFSETIEKNFEAVLQAMRGELVTLDENTAQSVDEVSAAAGLLLARSANLRADSLIGRLTNVSLEQKQQLVEVAQNSSGALGLPSKILESNWTVDLYGLQRLAKRMREKIADGKLDDLIPVHPREANAYDRYGLIFGRLAREVMGYKGQSIAKYGNFVATYALLWMKGTPYPVILKKWIDFQRGRFPKKKTNDHVRDGFDFFETVLRFKMVQLGKAYIDVLLFVMKEMGHESRRGEVFDYALALELGVSTTSGRAFVELGTSRIAAIALEALFPDSELTPALAREKLAALNLKAVTLSPIILDELRQLRLIEVAPEDSNSAAY
ncbi:MAG: DEAD/DEAH box helicase [Pseudomonadota bacterium]